MCGLHDAYRYYSSPPSSSCTLEDPFRILSSSSRRESQDSKATSLSFMLGFVTPQGGCARLYLVFIISLR